MLTIKGGCVSAKGPVRYIGRDITGEAPLSKDIILQLEWLPSKGTLVKLEIGDFHCVDIGGCLLIVPDHLRILANLGNGMITLIGSKATGNIIEYSEWMPFLIQK